LRFSDCAFDDPSARREIELTSIGWVFEYRHDPPPGSGRNRRELGVSVSADAADWPNDACPDRVRPNFSG